MTIRTFRIGEATSDPTGDYRALDKKQSFERYLSEAAVFPLYDAGNIGMQMRKIWGVMMDPDFDLPAFADSSSITFKNSMEGVGLSLVA